MEKKRLTKKGGLNFADKDLSLADEWGYSHIYNRLAELEDKIEQGTLIEFPCKVGDTVYYPTTTLGYKGCIKYEIREIKIDNICINFNNDFVSDIGEYSTAYMVYGIDIFTTREEAEKRLKELQG